jgi:hypothetical protein
MADYNGCQIRDGRIIGSCLVKHPETIHYRLNPHKISEGRFRYTTAKHPLKDREGFLSGGESGIRHLHSLDLVHNDINPSNISRPATRVPPKAPEGLLGWLPNHQEPLSRFTE